MRTMLDSWRCFLDSLDSDGGHVVILCAFVIGGVWLFQRDATAGGQIITGSFGALLMMLRAVGSNKEQVGGSTTLVTTKETHVEPPTNP